MLAAAFALRGSGAEAAEVRPAGSRLLPHFTIADFRRNTPGDNPVYPAQRERICQGMRRAGIPEGVRRRGESTGVRPYRPKARPPLPAARVC